VQGRHARRRGRRRPLRWAAPLTPVLALALTATGVTFARLSATESGGTNSFTTLRVSLTDTGITSCPITGVYPNAASSSCGFTASYTGSASAYLGLDVLVEAPTTNGTAALFKPSDSANDLQITISSASPSVLSYAVPGPASSVTCPGGLPGGAACYQSSDDLVSTSPFTSASPTISFSVSVDVPASSPTSYEGGTASIVMTVHAVQSRNNPLPGGCTTAGASCPASGSFSWS